MRSFRDDYVCVFCDRYEIATTGTNRRQFEDGIECSMSNYTQNSDGTIRVDNSGSLYPGGERSGSIGTARQINGGKFEVTFAPPSYNLFSPYWIVGLFGEVEQGYR